MKSKTGIRQKLEQLAKKINQLEIVPIDAETLSLYPQCATKASLSFLLSIFLYAREKLQNTAKTYSNTIQDTGFSSPPLSLVTPPTEKVVLSARRGVPLSRRIKIEDQEFQIQGRYTDIANDKKTNKLRVIEYIMTEKNDVPKDIIKKTTIQAQIKSWILSQYKDAVGKPSIAAINTANRTIIFQNLVSYIETVTEKKIKKILKDLKESLYFKRVEKCTIENCKFRTLCEKLRETSSCIKS